MIKKDDKERDENFEVEMTKLFDKTKVHEGVEL